MLSLSEVVKSVYPEIAECLVRPGFAMRFVFSLTFQEFFITPSFNKFKDFWGVYCHLDYLTTLNAQNSLF